MRHFRKRLLFTVKRTPEKVNSIGKLIFVFFITFSVNVYAEENVIMNMKVNYVSKGISSQRIEKQIDYRQIKGTVVDESGVPVPGANVVVKGTTMGTVSDANGYFSIKVERGVTLVVSCIGFVNYEINIVDQNTLSIVLKEETETLEEVVVVGYGSQKKENLTGSVTQISGEVLESRPITSISDGLQGRISGLNMSKSNGAPGTTSSWNIRGFTGLGTLAAPLILVDGVEMNPDLINPNDIENISVLKDAAASAIYGSRAPYGVVLITTKRGKAGKVEISYSNNFMIKKLGELPEPVNSVDFARTFNHAANNSQLPPIFTEETMEKMIAYIRDPKHNPCNSIGSDGMWMNFGQAHGNTNWKNEFFKSSQFSQNHSVSLRGGALDGKVGYFASVGYVEDKGLLRYAPKDQFSRWNFNVKVNSEISKWLSIATDIKYSKRDQERPNFPDWYIMNKITRIWPNIPAWEPDGTMYPESVNYDIMYGGSYKDNWDDLSSKISTEVRPFKGFSVNINYNFVRAFQKYQQNEFNFEVPLPSGDTKIGGANPNAVTALMRNNDYWQCEVYMKYSLDWRKHHVQVMAGHQAEEQNYKMLWGKKTQMITQEIPSISTSVGNQYSDDEIGHWSTEGYFLG